MKKIIIFSGTTEGRNLSELMAAAGIAHTVSVATDYGKLVMKAHPKVKIQEGRLSKEAMSEFLRKESFDLVIDATHPYAVEVTRTIKSCVAGMKADGLEVTYLRLKRSIQASEETGLRFFDSNEACAEALKEIKGNILLTTGSKELSVYTASEEVKKRLYVRVLPGMESLEICRREGILPQQILALQGPFSEELNDALIHQYGIKCMVTKQGGITGGFLEKKEAALKNRIPLLIIRREATEEDGLSFDAVCEKIETLTGVNLSLRPAELMITLAGIGPGDADMMTVRLKEALAEADLVLGAKRLIEAVTPKLEKEALYLPDKILTWLKEKSRQYAVHEKLKVVILFSGDIGFYSGWSKVRICLQEALQKDILHGTLQSIPGISSIQMMAAACGVSWENAGIYSIHGKTDTDGWQAEVLHRLHENGRLFLLVSGAEDIRKLGALFSDKENCRIKVGYQLSYPQQKLMVLTPEACRETEQEGLYVVMIEKEEHEAKEACEEKGTQKVCEVQEARGEQEVAITISPGIPDEAFIRGKVPMTKGEVRQVSLCSLRLQKDSVLYDIGSGTGSIAVEAAHLSRGIKVYAIEKKEEALALLAQNKEKFQVANMEIIRGMAPEACNGLEEPTHVFIGGSGGHLMEILEVLAAKKRRIRVVMNAISLETVAEFKQVKERFSVCNFEMIQMQVSRYHELGSYYMPKAENPVMICSFDLQGGEADAEA